MGLAQFKFHCIAINGGAYFQTVINGVRRDML